MFDGDLPDYAHGRTARVAAGLGTIARVAGEGRPIYARKLTFAEAKARVETGPPPLSRRAGPPAGGGAHRARRGDPDRLALDAGRRRARPAGPRRRPCDIVLGDRFGAACSPKLTGLVERELEALGYRVARNAPYAGGYTTEHYGRPARRTHALQIEINRALYMNETTREPTGGLARLTADAETLTRALAALDLGELR
jgi:N-formylglutamate amidohydrolase